MNTGFQWPKEITASREEIGNGAFAYNLTHETVGRLGRILLAPVPTGGSILTCEVLSIGSAEEIEARRAVLEPVVRAVSREFSARTGK